MMPVVNTVSEGCSTVFILSMCQRPPEVRLSLLRGRRLLKGNGGCHFLNLKLFPVKVARRGTFAVEAAVQVQPLQDKLHRRGYYLGPLVLGKPPYCSGQAVHPLQELHIFRGWPLAAGLPLSAPGRSRLLPPPAPRRSGIYRKCVAPPCGSDPPLTGPRGLPRRSPVRSSRQRRPQYRADR